MAWSRSLTAGLTLISLLVGIALSRPFSEADGHSEFVTVQKIAGNVQRSKRSAGLEFPSNAMFQFKMATGHVVLDLEMSSNSRRDIPVYTIGKLGLDLRNVEKQDNYAVYQDVSHGASVLIKYPYGTTEEYHLLGEFSHNGSHYQIEPAASFHRNKRDDDSSDSRDNRHIVRRQAVPNGNFDGDALVPPPDNAKLQTLTKNNLPVVRPEEEGVFPNDLKLQILKEEDDQGNLENDLLSTPQPSFGRRTRRQTETLYIEYIVVADYRNFQRWTEKVSGSTDDEITYNAYEAMIEYYAFIVNGIDLRFRTATGRDSNMRVVFASLLVSTEESTSPWLQGNKLGGNTVDDAGMLYSFALWRNSVYDSLPTHDHAGLYTGFDIATPSSTSPIGMGYLDSICHVSWAVSETEEAYSALTVHIAAHELGHNLGSRHDGSGNGCSSSALYLMAPRLPFVYNHEGRSNPWTFSSCSQTSVWNHVNGLQSGNCLKNRPSYLTESEPGDGDGTVPAGLRYSPDDQCNMTYGGGAVLCRENFHGRWDTICYAIQCRKKGTSYCEDRFFPFDRTPCGDKQWCRAGQCVYSDDAPPRHPTCPHGDDPSAPCSFETSCKDTDSRSRDILCCGTCNGLNNITTSSPTQTTSASTSSSTSTSTSSSLATTILSSSSTGTDITSSFTTSDSLSTYSSSITTSADQNVSSTESSISTTNPEYSTSISTKNISTTSTSTTVELPNSFSTSVVTNSVSTLMPPGTTSNFTSTDYITLSTVGTTTVSDELTTVSTTQTAMSTSSSSTTITPTQSEIPPVADPKQGLSLKLQTLVSLFIAAAIVV